MMKRLVLFFVLIFAIHSVFTVVSRAEDSSGTTVKGMTIVPTAQRHALLIGIDGYPPPVSKLNFCVKDMQDLAVELEKVGFPKENIHLMVDSSSDAWKPTSKNIVQQVKSITDAMNSDDFLFVAFSGHGVLIDGVSYLCPLDVDPAKQDSFVNRDELFKQIDGCEASRKIFLCDACRNDFKIKGSGGRGLLDARALTDPLGSRQFGFILMSSCAEKQQSLEIAKFGNGVFTHFLLEGLRGAAASDEGYISVMRLFVYADEKTKIFTKGRQTPMFRPGGEMGDFIIAHVDRPKIRPELPTIRIEDITGKISWGDIEIPASKPILVENLTLPPVPAEITRQRLEIQLIQSTIQMLKDGTHPALQQSIQATRQAKEVLSRAVADLQEIDSDRKEMWSVLPESTQKELFEEIQKNPKLSISSVRGLCPEEVSFVDFAKMVREGQRVQPVWKEYFRLKAEYDRIASEAAAKLSTALSDLNAQLKAKEDALPKMIEDFRTQVFLTLMSDLPGYDALDAAFPFDELITRIPAMEQYEFDWQEKDLFADAENVWTAQRPCVFLERQRMRELEKKCKPGERLVKTVNGVEFAFRWCPAGSFQMGSESGNSDEKPVHEVTLTRGFWLLETEVTQAQWQAVMGNNPSYFHGNNLPVECVSWEDCKEFCTKLSSQGLNVSLPTEAQWEYACRAGTTGAYAGNLDEMAWYDDNSGSTTHEVGQKKPNAWGLYDMHGNVYEWCSDWWDSYSESPASDPTGPSSGTLRVFRGGSWNNDAQYCRSANRNGNTPTNRSRNIGFRPVFLPQFP